MVSKLVRYQNYFLLGLAMLSVQIGSSFAKDMLQTIHPITMTWLRLCFGGLILSGIALPVFLRQSKNRTRQEWRALFILALSVVGMNTFFYISLKWLPVGMAVTIEFMGPLTVGLLAMTRRRDLLWVLLAGFGVVSLGGSMDFTQWQGILFAALAGVGWFSYIIYGAKIKNMWSGSVAILLACVVGSVALAPIAIITDGPTILQSDVLVTGAVIGLMSTAAPLVLELHILKSIDLSVFGILTSFEPALAITAGYLILGETITTTQWVAVGAIILAAVGVTVSKPPARVLAVDILQEKHGPFVDPLHKRTKAGSISGGADPIL